MLDINWIKNNHFKQKNFKEYSIHAESETQLFFFLLFSFSLIVAQELLQDFFTLIYFQVFAFMFDRGSFLHGDRFNQEIRSRCEFRAPRAERFTSVPVVSSPSDNRYHCHRDFSGLSIVKNIRLHFMFTSAYTIPWFISCNVCT